MISQTYYGVIKVNREPVNELKRKTKLTFSLEVNKKFW